MPGEKGWSGQKGRKEEYFATLLGLLVSAKKGRGLVIIKGKKENEDMTEKN